jgi:hypothetical protein
MDCGNDGGRVPRPVLPKVRNQTGGGNSLLGGQVCRGRQLPKCRPVRVANRSWSRKRVGMQGREKEQWLAQINGWATYQGSMDGKYTRSCSKALISYRYKWPPLQSVQKVSRYSLFREGAMNTAGKDPIEALINLWRLTDIALWIKSIFEEMIIKTAFGLRLSSLWS